MADPFAPRSMKRKNVKGLALTPAAPKPPPTAENHSDLDGGYDGASKDGQLEIGIEYKLDLRPEDLEIVKELGSGNGGTVSKVKHSTTGTVMARKVNLLAFLGKTALTQIHRSFMSMRRKRCENKSSENSRLCTAAIPTTLSIFMAHS